MNEKQDLFSYMRDLICAMADKETPSRATQRRLRDELSWRQFSGLCRDAIETGAAAFEEHFNVGRSYDYRARGQYMFAGLHRTTGHRLLLQFRAGDCQDIRSANCRVLALDKRFGAEQTPRWKAWQKLMTIPSLDSIVPRAERQQLIEAVRCPAKEADMVLRWKRCPRTGTFYLRGQRPHVTAWTRLTLSPQTPQLTRQQFTRVLRRFHPGATVEWAPENSKELVPLMVLRSHDGHDYHTTESSLRLCCVAEVIRVASHAWAKRRKEAHQKKRNAMLDQLLARDGAKVFVSVQDSLDSGNCEPMTNAFANELRAKMQATGDIGAVSASVILGLRDDSYTRRACRLAAIRYHHRRRPARRQQRKETVS